MIPWSLLKTFSIPLALWLFRNGYAYYKSLRASYNRQKPSVRPVPQQLKHALNLLFLFSIFAFCYTLPYFTPQNVFKTTDSRFQTPTNVLFTRLAAQRNLSATDEILKQKLSSKSGRLLYLMYGPETLTTCQFCTEEDPVSYLIHALPKLLAPHLAHLVVVGVATSRLFGGPEGSRWRYQAVVAALALGALDLYNVWSYDMNINRKATSSKDLDAFFWRARVMRGLALLMVDIVMAGILWASGTNRLFVKPFATIDRLSVVEQALQRSNFRLWATGNVRNAVVRDRRLKDVIEQYWEQENEIYEEREIVDAIRGALSRVDSAQLERAAAERAKGIIEAT